MPGQRPRALFLGIGRPWEESAGYLRRQAVWIEAIRQEFDTDVVLFSDEDGAHSIEPSGASPASEVRFLSKPPRRDRGFLAQLLDRFRWLPQSLVSFDRESTSYAVSAIDDGSHELVFVYRADVLYWSGLAHSPRLVVDIDDPESRRRRRQSALEDFGLRRRLYEFLECSKLYLFEQSIVRRCGKTFVCNIQDADYLAPGKVDVLPNSVRVPDCEVAPVTPPSLVFLGSTVSLASPNADALEWFVDGVWDRVLAEIPDAELRVIGKTHPRLGRSLDRREGVTVVGYVDDLADELGPSSVSIVPIRYGTGSRIKILDAWALGSPVITTSPGIEGLDHVAGVDAVIADSPGEFADACIELLRDPERRKALAENGLEAVAKYEHHAVVRSARAQLRESIARQPAR